MVDENIKEKVAFVHIPMGNFESVSSAESGYASVPYFQKIYSLRASPNTDVVSILVTSLSSTTLSTTVFSKYYPYHTELKKSVTKTFSEVSSYWVDDQSHLMWIIQDENLLTYDFDSQETNYKSMGRFGNCKLDFGIAFCRELENCNNDETECESTSISVINLHEKSMNAIQVGNSVKGFEGFYNEFGSGKIVSKATMFDDISIEGCRGNRNSMILHSTDFTAWFDVLGLMKIYTKEWTVTSDWTECSDDLLQTRIVECVYTVDHSIKFPAEDCGPIEDSGLEETSRSCSINTRLIDTPQGFINRRFSTDEYEILMVYGDNVVFVRHYLPYRTDEQYLERCDIDMEDCVKVGDFSSTDGSEAWNIKDIWIVNGELYVHNYLDKANQFKKAKLSECLDSMSIVEFSVVNPSQAVQTEMTKVFDTEFYVKVQNPSEIVFFDLKGAILLYSSEESRTIDTFIESDLVITGSSCAASADIVKGFSFISHTVEVFLWENDNQGSVTFYVNVPKQTPEFIHCVKDDTNAGKLKEGVVYSNSDVAPTSINSDLRNGILFGADSKDTLYKLNFFCTTADECVDDIVEKAMKVTDIEPESPYDIASIRIAGKYFSRESYNSIYGTNSKLAVSIFTYDYNSLELTLVLNYHGDVQEFGSISKVLDSFSIENGYQSKVYPIMNFSHRTVSGADQFVIVNEIFEFNWSIGEFGLCYSVSQTVTRSVECWNPFGEVQDDSACESFLPKPTTSQTCENSLIIKPFSNWQNLPSTFSSVFFACGNFIVGDTGRFIQRCEIGDSSGDSCLKIDGVSSHQALLIDDTAYFLNYDNEFFTIPKEKICSSSTTKPVEEDFIKGIWSNVIIEKLRAYETEVGDFDDMRLAGLLPVLKIQSNGRPSATSFLSVSENGMDKMTESDVILQYSIPDGSGIVEYELELYKDLNSAFLMWYKMSSKTTVLIEIGKFHITNGKLGSRIGSSLSYDVPLLPSGKDIDMSVIFSFNSDYGLLYTFDKYDSTSNKDPFKDISICQYNFGVTAKKCANLNTLITNAGGNGDRMLCVNNIDDGLLWCREVVDGCNSITCKSKMVHIYHMKADLTLVHLMSGNYINGDSESILLNSFEKRFTEGDEFLNEGDSVNIDFVISPDEHKFGFMEMDPEFFSKEYTGLRVQTSFLPDLSHWEASQWSECQKTDVIGESVMTRTVQCIDSNGLEVDDVTCTAYQVKPILSKSCTLRSDFYKWNILKDFENVNTSVSFLFENIEKGFIFFGVGYELQRCVISNEKVISNCENFYKMTNYAYPTEVIFNESNMIIIGSFGNEGTNDMMYILKNYNDKLFNPTIETITDDLCEVELPSEDMLVRSLMANSFSLSFGGITETGDRQGQNVIFSNGEDTDSSDISHLVVRYDDISNCESESQTVMYASSLPGVSFNSEVSSMISVDKNVGSLTIIHGKYSESSYQPFENWDEPKTFTLKVNDVDIGSFDTFEVDVANKKLFTLTIGDDNLGFSKRRLCQFTFDFDGSTTPIGSCINETEFLPNQKIACGFSNSMLFCKNVSPSCNDKTCHPTTSQVFTLEDFPTLTPLGFGSSFENDKKDLMFKSFQDLNQVISPLEFFDLKTKIIREYDEISKEFLLMINSDFFGESNIVLKITKLPGFMWVESEWSTCSKECDGGISTREVVCKQGSTIVSDEMCKMISSKPQLSKTCNPQHCYNWSIGEEWSSCSKICDGGVSTRSVVCKDLSDETVSDSKCISYVPKPESSKVCNDDIKCFVYGSTDWSECSEMCGDGKQTRQLTCSSTAEDGKLVDISKCKNYGPQPVIEKTCHLRDCEWLCVDSDTNRVSKEACSTCKYGSIWSVCCPEDMSAYCTKVTLCDYSERPEVLCGSKSPCDGIDCGDNGTCSYSIGEAPKCDCNVGYSGDKCENHEQSAVYFYDVESWGKCSKDCGEDGTKTRDLICKKLENGIITTESPQSDMCDFVTNQPKRSISCNRFACEIQKKRVKFALSFSGSNFKSILRSNRKKFEETLTIEISLALSVSTDNIEILSIGGVTDNSNSDLRRQLSSSNNGKATVQFTVVPEGNEENLDDNIKDMVAELKDPESDIRKKSTYLSQAKVDSLVIEKNDDSDDDDSSGPGIVLFLVLLVLFVMIVGGIGGVYYVMVLQPKLEQKNNPHSSGEPANNDIFFKHYEGKGKRFSVTNPMHNHMKADVL
eukprot:TRINITY_DN537_c0_g3_i1.p1 TRINITY_DN537_c0_g3~~TRINITY_DN537_c0_g3_i1.p1  ORF type:complete len:2361 (+),score=658.13 TRINITY_DN537_c0_g3_i1:515-7084(+)